MAWAILQPSRHLPHSGGVPAAPEPLISTPKEIVIWRLPEILFMGDRLARIGVLSWRSMAGPGVGS